MKSATLARAAINSLRSASSSTTSCIACVMHSIHWSRSALPIANGIWR
jgi:hypothetical protein